ncbi:MAG: ATP-binding protein [Cyanobacteria bacterium P01_A01_bin.45]
MIKIFGNFLERLIHNNHAEKTDIYGSFKDSLTEKEHLTLEFSPSKISLNNRWGNNSLSANFIGDYLVTFFPHENDNHHILNRQKLIRSSVSYIANELLENAMKYCDETSNFPITLHAQVDGDNIRLFVDNSVLASAAEKFKNFIKEFMVANPEEFYISQLEKTAVDNNSKYSGLGFVTIVNDYSAKIGWRFQMLERESPLLTVTTMVEISV